MSIQLVFCCTVLILMNCEITNVRDFLVHLPKLAGYDYNEVVSYLIFKTLNLLLKCPTENVDWSSLVAIFESEKWKDGTYKRVLQDVDWKTQISSNNLNVSHRGCMCSRICYPTETVYYCFTCTTNPLYEICEGCFDRSKHAGHSFTAKLVVRPEGRVCHCGDPYVFKEPQFAFLCKKDENNDQRNPPIGYDELAFSIFSVVLDYLIDVTIYFGEQNEGYRSTASIKEMGKGVNTHYTVLKDSRDQIDEPDPNDMRWTLQIDEEDCQMHYMDLTAKIARILNKPTEYAIAMTNMLENGTSSVTVLTSSDREKLEQISLQFQNEGARNHIRRINETFKRDLIEDLIDWLCTIFSSELISLETKASLRLCLLDKWNSGLLSTKLTSDRLSTFVSKITLLGGFLVSYEQRDNFPWFTPWNFDFDFQDDRLTSIMSDYNKRLKNTDIPNSVARFHSFHGSRFQYILTEFPNFLSRVSRNKILKILCTVFAIADDARRYLAAQYLDVYLAVLYSTVASDTTGFKVSMMSILSQYTLQDPEIANIAIRSGFVQRTLRFAFTLMAFNPEDLVAYLPIPLYYGCKLPNDTIRNRRTIICFKDICILMSTNTIPEELMNDIAILNAVVESFAEFNSVLPLKRETCEHVEFENFDFSSYYFFFSSILIMTDGYVRSISLLLDSESRRRIVYKLVKIAMEKEFKQLGHKKYSPYCSSPKAFIDKKHENPGLRKVQENICGHTTDVINFQVGVDTQNFFNPMSYLFKFVLQWSQCGRYEPLPNGLKNCINFQELFQDKMKALYISEASLSTLILLSQINIGFWVRNGTPITHQARMYTRYSMREFTYMSDIFNVQFSMVFSDPNDFFVSFLSRWGLKHWANGFPMGDFPDSDTTVAMVNQCLLLLIQLFTEIKSLTMVSSIDGFEKTLKAEIIHALCYKNCTYSQIMNDIPEHITKHAAFDLYLEKYTNYTPPSGSMDCGVYTLKSEFRAEIDPFFIGMSSNKRYEAEKCIRSSMATKYKLNYDDTFIPPRKVIDSLKNTPYFGLYSISSAETFGMFLKNTLDHISKFEYESLLPTVVHLIHLCVINNLNDFMKIFWHEYTSMEAADYYYHSVGSILYRFLLKDNFSSVHGAIREIFRYLTEAAPHVDAASYLQEQAHPFNADVLWSSSTVKNSKDEEFERKKKMARIKKEKVIKSLTKQQMKFIENNSISTTDDEELKESSADSDAGGLVGWKFPEDTCVFCKMPYEDDVFVYFSYQENNICDLNVDFSRISDVIEAITQREVDDILVMEQKQNYFTTPENSTVIQQMTLTYQDSVMKTCGHGSHISCLGNHMKSIRTAHNQTTKNVPVAYGFGLLYCPLCNGLCNSFLPKILESNCRVAKNFFENNFQNSTENISNLLLSTSLKAARICEDLTENLPMSKRNPFEVVNQIFISTILNTELSLRSLSADTVIHEMPNQRLLTLRLLSELKSTLLKSCPNKKNLFYAVKPSNLFKLNDNAELLSLASEIIESPEQLKYPQFTVTPLLCLKELVKTEIWRNCVVLSKELLKVKFYQNDTRTTPWNSHVETDENSQVEATMLMKVLKTILFCLNPMITSSFFEGLDLIKSHLHQLIAGSFKIFLRRLCMVFYSRYAVELVYSQETNFSREIDFLLEYLQLPPFVSIIQEFCEQDAEQCFKNLKETLEGNASSNIIENFAFTSPRTAKLVNLPISLSHFAFAEGNRLTQKAVRDEISICLFCGKACRIQRSVALHGYVQGECTNHVRNECKLVSAYGVFLMVKSNSIYLSYGNRGCFYPAPYLHKHGETDADFKFNNPVFLDYKRYENLMNGIILGNMIPHIVFRLTDGNSDLGGWETM